MASKIALAFVALIISTANGENLPASPNQTALMARYIVNEAEWASVGSISTQNDSKGYPYVSLVSSSDGALGKGSGIVYLFITPLDVVGQNLEKDSRVTIMMTLAQGDYCKNKGYDPLDPRCPRVVFTGRIRKVNQEDPEYETAKKAIFTRHEWLSHMPANHHFYFAKLEIETMIVRDKLAYITDVSPTEYYDANSNAIEAYARRYRYKN